jgi:hypothetical protein
MGDDEKRRYWTVEELVTEYGHSRAAAEQEVKRATCEHDYGKMCESTFMGCVRTCLKCGQMLGLNRNCWEHRTTKAKDDAAR